VDSTILIALAFLFKGKVRAIFSRTGISKNTDKLKEKQAFLPGTR
jgi:hypothetical protein